MTCGSTGLGQRMIAGPIAKRERYRRSPREDGT